MVFSVSERHSKFLLPMAQFPFGRKVCGGLQERKDKAKLSLHDDKRNVSYVVLESQEVNVATRLYVCFCFVGIT